MDKNQFDEQIKLIKTNMENIEDVVRLMYANRLIDNVEGQVELQKLQSSIDELSNENKLLKQEIADLKVLIDTKKDTSKDYEDEAKDTVIDTMNNTASNERSSSEENIISIQEIQNYRVARNGVIGKGTFGPYTIDKGTIGCNVCQNGDVKIKFCVINKTYSKREKQCIILKRRYDDSFNIEICGSLQEVCYNAALYIIKYTNVGRRLLGDRWYSIQDRW